MAEIDPTASSRPTFSGLATGLDTSSLINSLMQFERRPLTQIESRRDDIKDGQEAVQKLNSLVLDLRNAAREIDNRSTGLDTATFSEELLSYEASSGDEGVVTAQATSTAAPGSYRIHVDTLAAVARRVSASFASADTAVGAGSLQIAYGGSATIDISTSGTTTLSQLRDAINGDANNVNGAVRADVISDGTGYRLVIAGTEPGAAHDLSVTTGLSGPSAQPFIDGALGNAATDASLTYLGLTVTRGSNDVTDLIPGVTLSLTGTNAVGAETEVDVTRDDDAIVAKIQKLVDAFNAVHSFIKEQNGTAEKKGGPLGGDSLLATIEGQARRALGRKVAFGSAQNGDPFYASDLGIRFQKDGSLELNASALKERLAQNPEAVKRLLSGVDPTDAAANDGIATALARALHPILDSERDATTGETRASFFKARQDAISLRLRDMEDQISRFEERLAKREETLRRQFANLEELVSSLQGQSSFLSRIG